MEAQIFSKWNIGQVARCRKSFDSHIELKEKEMAYQLVGKCEKNYV